MKSLLIVSMLLVGLEASASVRVVVPAVEETYCRSVPSTGIGSPRGIVREHCVTLKGGSMTDNASTFFGNPPETLPCVILENSVMVLRNGHWVEVYQIENGALVNDVGAVLTLK